jgi:hypothetical protein
MQHTRILLRLKGHMRNMINHTEVATVMNGTSIIQRRPVIAMVMVRVGKVTHSIVSILDSLGAVRGEMATLNQKRNSQVKR